MIIPRLAIRLKRMGQDVVNLGSAAAVGAARAVPATGPRAAGHEVVADTVVKLKSLASCPWQFVRTEVRGNVFL